MGYWGIGEANREKNLAEVKLYVLLSNPFADIGDIYMAEQEYAQAKALAAHIAENGGFDYED